MKIAVPAYFYPTYQDPVWGAMQSAWPICTLAVANVNSGPNGPTIDTNYQSQIILAQRAGLTVVGYVDSAYATKSLANFQAEVDTWFSLYSVTGIFVDQVTTSCLNSTYYAAINSYVKSINASYTVVMNPGTIVPSCFSQLADILITFEGTLTQYQTWAPSGWEQNFTSNHFWHIIHNAAEADLDALLAVSSFRNVGLIYVTNGVEPNPYDSLPTYWSVEVETLLTGGAPVMQISVLFFLCVGLLSFMLRLIERL